MKPARVTLAALVLVSLLQWFSVTFFFPIYSVDTADKKPNILILIIVKRLTELLEQKQDRTFL